jgi:hypothetical protein
VGVTAQQGNSPYGKRYLLRRELIDKYGTYQPKISQDIVGEIVLLSTHFSFPMIINTTGSINCNQMLVDSDCLISYKARHMLCLCLGLHF